MRIEIILWVMTGVRKVLMDYKEGMGIPPVSRIASLCLVIEQLDRKADHCLAIVEQDIAYKQEEKGILSLAEALKNILLHLPNRNRSRLRGGIQFRLDEGGVEDSRDP